MPISKSLTTALIDGTGAITPANVTVSTNTMTVGTAMYVVANGNVGVNTSTPTLINNTYSGIHVNGGVGSTLKLSNANTGSNSTSGYEFLLGSDGTGYVWHRNSSNIIFGTAATERVRILANGNIGIGNASPIHSLSVNGQAYVGGELFANSGGQCIRVGTSTGADHGYIGFYPRVATPSSRGAWLGFGGAGDDNLQMNNERPTGHTYLNTANGNISLCANGNVGINTNSPDVKLRIVGNNVAGKGQIVLDSSDYSQITHYNGSTQYATWYTHTSGNLGGVYFGSVGAAPLQLIANSTTKVFIAANSNIGLSTVTPAARLEITGNDNGTHLIIGGTVRRLKFTTSTESPGVTDNYIHNFIHESSGGIIKFFGDNGNALMLQMNTTGPSVGIAMSPTSRNNTSLQVKDGIGFPATQVSSSDANTLDDYEEGSWTPACGTTGVTVSGISHAKYTKIGRFVHATTYLTLNNTSGGTKTYIQLTGLPFVSDGYGPINKYYGQGGVTTDTYIEASTTYGQMNFSSGSPLPTGASGWMFNFTYLTST